MRRSWGLLTISYRDARGPRQVLIHLWREPGSPRGKIEDEGTALYLDAQTQAVTTQGYR